MVDSSAAATATGIFGIVVALIWLVLAIYLVYCIINTHHIVKKSLKKPMSKSS